MVPCDVQLPVYLSISSLIAFMLGRLGMYMDQVISCYDPTKDIFSDTQTGRERKFKVSKLEKVIKDIVKVATGQEGQCMLGMPPDAKGCKS